ncbi:Spermidine export protein MdtI [Moellerella wisconsensis]|nr:Spermidine export protein MdtI [Moellerella wisconsensis]
MLSQFEWWHGAFLILAVILEILANILLKMSNGFKRIWLGVLSLLQCSGRLVHWHKRLKALSCQSLMHYGGLSALLPLLPPAGFYSISVLTTKVGVGFAYC